MKYFLKTTFNYVNFNNIIFAFIIMLVSIIFNLKTSNSYNHNILIFINGVTGPNILALTIIFIVILPSSLSLYEDMENEYIKSIIIRMNSKKYFFGKMFSIGILSGMFNFIFLTLFLLISINIGKLPAKSLNNFTTGAFNFLYPNNKLLYSIIFIINSFIFGFIFSIVGSITTLFWKNKYAPSIITFLIYIFSEPLLGIFKLNRFGFSNLFNYSDNFLTTPLSIYVEFSVILLFSLLIGYYRFKRVLNE